MTQAINPDSMGTAGDSHGDHSHAQDDHGHGHSHSHSPYLAHHFDTMEQQFGSAKLGMWIFLATEILMFGGLFCAYAIYRANHPDVFQFQHVYLNTFWGATNTAILLASSFTMAWAVRAAQIGKQKLLTVLLALTLCGGFGFMIIKYIEYAEKYEHTLWIGSNNAYFYDTREGSGFKYAGAEDEAHTFDHALDYHEKNVKKRYGGEKGAAYDAHSDDYAVAKGDGHDNHSSEHDSDSGGASAKAVDSTQAPLTVAESLAKSQGSAAVAPIEASTIGVPAFGPSGTSADLLIADAAPDAHGHRGHTVGSWDDLTALEQKRAHIFFQIYFMMTGLHGFHVLVGISLIGYLFVRSLYGVYHTANFAAVDIIGLYWHLVDLIWIFLFPLLYLIH